MKRYVLEYTKGLLQKTVFVLEGETTLGRSRRNDIAIEDPSISRTHAKVTARGGEWFLWDLTSSNGTFVNGERVQISPLHHGDIVNLGSVQLRFLEMEVWEDARSVAETAEAPPGEPEDESPEPPREIKDQIDLVTTFLEALPLGVAIINDRMEARYLNRTLASFAGKGQTRDGMSVGAVLGCVAGKSDPAVCESGPECTGCLIREPVQKVFREGVPALNLEVPWPRKGSLSPTHIQCSVIPIPYSLTGEPLALVTVEDVTGRKRAEERIRQLAYHDALTGLPNRALFHDRLRLAMAQVQRNRRSLAVMFLDLDRFKDVNDSLGHTVGDQLLKEVANRLTDLLRKGDTVARMGGDEFLLLLPEITGVGDAATIAAKILQAVQKPFTFGDQGIHITTSIGIAIFPEDGNDPDNLIKNADVAMYRAKELGRNNYQRFGESGDHGAVG